MNSKLPYNFKNTDRKILIGKHDLPNPWINYLSNGRMHAFVSQAGGGMCWWRTTQNYRMTRYRFYNLPIDSPGFYVYIRMQDGTVWSPTFRPCETKLDSWEAAHSTGYSQFSAEKDGIRATLTLFMATDSDTLIWDLRLINLKGEDVECDVFAYVEFSQLAFENEVKLGYYLKWNVDNHYDSDLDSIIYLYTSWLQIDTEKAPLIYFSSSEKANSFCCNRDLFCGNYRDERNPIEIEKGVLSNTNMAGGEPCGAIHNRISLNAHEEKRINFFLGLTTGALKNFEDARERTKKTLSELKSNGAVDAQFAKNEKWWNEHLGVYQCVIPDEDAQRQINIWNPIQSVATARYSRSISSSASGIRGVGYRDSAQDMLAQAYRKPEWAKEMLFYLCSQQREDGHAVHACWPEDNKLPQELMRSDDHIWPIYLAYAIASETGDLSFLDEKVPFLGDDLKTPVDESSVWEHFMRGIKFTENHLGSHGLPLILFSDWNDHMGPFGRKGKGESTFVAHQHILALRQLSEMAEVRGDFDEAERFRGLIKKQENALEKYCWDGEWYLRGFDDDGAPIGSKDAEYAKIWVNAQSWMIISGCGTKEQNLLAMDSVGKHMDTGMGLLINTPGLPSSKANGLPAGYSENGGIFCQANCWAIMAEAILGRGNNAWKYYKQLIPHEIIKRIGVDSYRGEAYAYSSTMLGPANEKFGQACVSQVTGTSAWMDVVSTQYILGIRPTLKGLLISPSIPASWDSYTVQRVYRGCKLNILVENPNQVQHGVKQMYLNDAPIDISNGAYITKELLGDLKTAEVRVLLG